MTVLQSVLAAQPLLPLLGRMAAVAIFVVLVALLAQRMGPFLGGMIASLPLYTGPVYLLLALDHDAHFFEATSVTSVAICGAIPVFVLVYAILARSQGSAVSLSGALAGWLAIALFVQAYDWTLPEALLFVAPIYAVALPLAQGFTRGVAIRHAPRHWSDLVLRGALVAILTGAVIVASQHVPPTVTGILSVLPVLLASLTVVMHPRVGGPATAALLAHTLGGLIGMVLAFSLVHLTIARAGVWPVLASALSLTVGWNIMLIVLRRLARTRS